MLQTRRRSRLGLESLQDASAPRFVDVGELAGLDQFQRDDPTCLSMSGAIHHPHAAAAEPIDDLMIGDHRSRRKRIACRRDVGDGSRAVVALGVGRIDLLGRSGPVRRAAEEVVGIGFGEEFADRPRNSGNRRS